jgi:hypothetical protein
VRSASGLLEYLTFTGAIQQHYYGNPMNLQ